MSIRSERVKRFINQYYDLKKQNPEKTISEFASDFKITTRTIYDVLDIIAEKHGVNRKELLDVPHKKHAIRGSKSNSDTKKETLTAQQLNEEFENLISDIKYIMSDIEDVCTVHKDFIKHMEDNNDES